MQIMITLKPIKEYIIRGVGWKKWIMKLAAKSALENAIRSDLYERIY